MVDVTPSLLLNGVNITPGTQSANVGIGGVAASAQNAEKARIWAEGTDQEVEDLGGEHSAKVWAEKAEQELVWGNIDGTLSNQTDLQTALNAKQDVISDLATIRSGASAGATAVQPGDLATVATTGNYNDLSNLPSIPSAQVQADWAQNDNTKIDFIKNKPTLSAVATSGNYNDLSNLPTIPEDIKDLGDVAISSPTNGDGLVYDSSAQKWKNGSFTATAAWGAITGALADQTDLKSALDGKQNTIANLATIESGAAAGATAVQPGDLATVATTGDYDDLINKPTIPTVNDATLTIQKNGTQVATFTANSSSNATANITVPTDTGDLTNGAGYITGITSGDVTTALGYTPYNSSNPNGYTSNVGTVTSVNNTSPDGSGNVSLTIPAEGADKDLSNITSTANKVISSLSAPSTTYDTLTLGASGSSYTAPGDGYFVLQKAFAAGQYMSLESSSGIGLTCEASALTDPTAFLPMKKGQTATIYYTGTGGVDKFIFLYTEGNK